MVFSYRPPRSTSGRPRSPLRGAATRYLSLSAAATNLALLAAVTTGALIVGVVASAVEPADASVARRITFPVDPAHIDRLHWSDTWGAPRGGGRTHIGVDLLGPKMIPLVAANDSVLKWGRYDNARGSIVRFRDAAGWEYQYIHMNNDTPGTDDGQASCSQVFSAKICGALTDPGGRREVSVKAGEFIGFLGDSGNAEGTAAHLHFEVYRPTANGPVPVNPTPFVDDAVGRVAEPAERPVGSFDGATAAADRLFQRLEGRAPSAAERDGLRARILGEGIESTLASMVEDDPPAAAIDRLYLAFFRRPPDDEGWNHWLEARAGGHDLDDVAEWFARSEEFQTRYPRADFGQFLDQLYLDVLGRQPDAEGRAYWLDQLKSGRVDRGTIVVYFTEGVELRRAARWRTELTVLHRALGRERPTPDEVEAWGRTRTTTDLPTAIGGLLD